MKRTTEGPGIDLKLPVVEALPTLRAALARHGSAVLTAPPGSGKTTAVPLALLDEEWLGGGKILLTEPRRLAARAAARYMASRLNEQVGESIGYRVRHDTKCGPRTRIEVITEGVLVRRIQNDPGLEGVGLVIFDELHERNVETDLALALLIDARNALRDDLRVLAMSATLDEKPIAALLGNAPVVRAYGRLHTVALHHLGAPGRENLAKASARTAIQALGEGTGDVLVFLPGVREIVEASREVERLAPTVLVCPLYGDLSADVQDRAIQPDPQGRRRVVIATNIAESSLTIAGVGAVVDAGQARAPRFDPATGLTRLDTIQISRAEAQQRAGRAGRLGPGRCYRLWSSEQHERLADARPPAIRVADLAAVLLETAVWGVTDPQALCWLDPPPRATVAQARALLEALGALDLNGRITERGRAMADLPVHPRLAAMIAADNDPTTQALACDLAAILEARDPLARGSVGADVTERLIGLAEKTRQFASISRDALSLRRRLGVEKVVAASPARAGRLLCVAYPDRVSQRRGAVSERSRYQLASGRGARLIEGDPLGRADYIVVANLDSRVDRADSVVRLAGELGKEELETMLESRIEVRERVRFEAREGAVVATEERRYGELVLQSRPIQSPALDQVTSAMLTGIRQLGLHALPWNDNSAELRARVSAVRAWHAGESWPDLSDKALLESIEQWLGPWLGGITRVAHLARVDLNGALEAVLSRAQRTRLDRIAPSNLALASGRRVKLDYQAERAPTLATRAQNLYGQTITPTVDEGRHPITLTLLSPAGRPIQITRDLAGFWSGSWSQVRKEMRARYPKHDWPVDPAHARAPVGRKRRS